MRGKGEVKIGEVGEWSAGGVDGRRIAYGELGCVVVIGQILGVLHF